MALTNTKQGIYVNISKGKFTIKNGEKYESYDHLTGRITGVEVRTDEYNGVKFDVAIFTIVDNIETYILKVRCDSGYFRSLCNALKSGDVNKLVKLSATYKEINGRPQTGMYVIQNERPLKHAHTKDNLGECPPLEKIVFKGKESWDNSKQLEFWKNWLRSLKFEEPKFEQVEVFDEVKELPNLPEDGGDLPF